MSHEKRTGLRACIGRLASEQINRTEAMWSEFGRLESAGTEQFRSAIDEWARLTQDSVTYSFVIHEQWRRASIEAARRTLELFGLR
jgi:hypothetical protein